MILVYIVTKCKSNHTKLCERIWSDKHGMQNIRVHCRKLRRDICIIATGKSQYAPPEEVRPGVTGMRWKAVSLCQNTVQIFGRDH